MSSLRAQRVSHQFEITWPSSLSSLVSGGRRGRRRRMTDHVRLVGGRDATTGSSRALSFLYRLRLAAAPTSQQSTKSPLFLCPSSASSFPFTLSLFLSVRCWVNGEGCEARERGICNDTSLIERGRYLMKRGGQAMLTTPASMEITLASRSEIISSSRRPVREHHRTNNPFAEEW